ncbi:XRE family transcriptional regulator [Tianweitania sediminis]|uniref:Helix-turn-helix domain-containing protein n=1 Tax=Tianweitania sediminis TaxID=1502156 RepID=A0A8J7RLY3_9HYPH|nr:S24 family peptidase [Tianweitania sediminis]MBP0439611.1 helix-turn-helix domain-containing protein [Tianweitania sediminis]
MLLMARAKNEKSAAIGAAIREARTRRGKVMREVAAHLGIDTAAVGNWETGRNLPSTQNLLSVAEFLQVDAVALGKGRVIFNEEDASSSKLNEAEIVSDPAPFPAGPNDVQILGASVGGEEGDFTFNGQIIGYTRRPPGIAHLNNVFAVHVIGDSMEPRFEPGDMIYCSSRTAVSGDDIVIEMFPEEGETVGKAYIKRLVRRAGGELVCMQYNPPKEVTFNVYALKRVYRVIPLRELVGF